MWLKENRAEQQHLTSSDGRKLSCTAVERMCIELTKMVDGIVKTAKEANVTDVSKTERALPDSASNRKVKAKEMEKRRDNETKTVLDWLMGSRAQLPLGSGTFVHDNNERRSLCFSAFDSASFPAPDSMFSVCW